MNPHCYDSRNELGVVEAFRANVEKSQYSTNWVIRYLKYIDANTKYLKLQQLYYAIWIWFGKNESLHFYWNKLMNLLQAYVRHTISVSIIKAERNMFS